MKHHFLALCLTLLASPLAIDAAETNSLAEFVRQADLVAHVQATAVERDPNVTAAGRFNCSATCVVRESLKGVARRGKICVYFQTRSDPVFEVGKDYITFLNSDGGTNQLGQEGFGLVYPTRRTEAIDAVRPYTRALWDEIRTNAPPRSSSGGSEPRGAKNGGGNLEFRDHTGNIVATGSLQLPERLPPGQTSFEGRWRLNSAKSSFPTNSTRSGTFRGFVHEKGLSINLNPYDSDNNVELAASLTNGLLSGTWSLTTLTGQKNMGSFTVTHPYGDAR